MRSQRLKIHDNKGNSYSMRRFKEVVKRDTLKDFIPKSLITGQKILTGGQIKKFISDGQLHEVNFGGQIYFNKSEIAKCLNANGINFNFI
jgi:hypothetical protein